jgi:hypothetical protein
MSLILYGELLKFRQSGPEEIGKRKREASDQPMLDRTMVDKLILSTHNSDTTNVCVNNAKKLRLTSNDSNLSHQVIGASSQQVTIMNPRDAIICPRNVVVSSSTLLKVATQDMTLRSVQECRYLISILPSLYQPYIAHYYNQANAMLNELTIDIGRPIMLRYSLLPSVHSQSSYKKVAAEKSKEISEPTVRTVEFVDCSVTVEHITHILNGLAAQSVRFSSDYRCGIPGTLHRISRKLNHHDDVIAFTIRFGYQMGSSWIS